MIDRIIRSRDTVSSQLIYISPASAGGRPSFRKAAFGAVDIEQQRRLDGSVVLRSRVPLSSYPRALTQRLVKWAEESPDRPFLARREGSGPFRVVTYGEALQRVERIAEWLLG